MNGREVKGMCDGQGSPTGVTEALAMLGRALDHLNAADMASLPAIVQAGALRALGQAEAKHTAARARVLGAFAAQGASGKKTGPEDTRTRWQRRHDALEEACRRLIRAGMVPARAGQPTQLLVHLSLAQLRGTPGASPVEDAWAADRTTQPGWLTGPEADAALCDATIVPIVTGHVDWAALDQLTETFLLTHGVGSHACSGAGQPAGPGQRSAPVQSAKSSQRFAPIQPAEPPGPPRNWARLRCTSTWVGCPARSGTIPARISRRHASSSAS